MVTISKPIDIDSRKVLKTIGYDADYNPPPRIATLVDDYVENASQLMAPSYSYVIKDIELVYGSGAVIEGWIAFGSEVVAQLLERCKKVAVFVLTIGGYLEEMVSQLADDGRMLQATVLDAVCSVAVERLAEFVRDDIGALAAARGQYVSRRFSPGHCDWDVKQQRLLFETMDGDSAGVELTAGCLMLPRKSISGIIGIGSRRVKDYNPCQTCDRYDCVGRK
jgi:hypothetical protein